MAMPELVSGWSDDTPVYLIERNGDSVGYRKVPARWSAFFLGLDDSDRAALARSKDVKALTIEGQYTRIDFTSRQARDDVVDRVGKAISKRRTVGYREPGDMTVDPAVLEADVRPLRRLLSDVGTLQV